MSLNNIDIWQFAVPFRQHKMNKANANGLTPRLMPSSSSNSSDPMSDMFEFWSLKLQKGWEKTLVSIKALQIWFQFVFAAAL